MPFYIFFFGEGSPTKIDKTEKKKKKNNLTCLEDLVVVSFPSAWRIWDLENAFGGRVGCCSWQGAERGAEEAAQAPPRTQRDLERMGLRPPLLPLA